MEKYKILKEQLKIMDLDAINEVFAVKAEEYRKIGLDYIDYLAELVNYQMKKRIDRSVNYRLSNAKFPCIKTYEGYDFEFQKSFKKTDYEELLSFEFMERKENIIFIGPPGVGKTHLSIGLGVKACEKRIRILYVTAEGIIEGMKIAKASKTLPEYIEKMSRYPLLIIDELGYMPLCVDDANLFFQLISRKYEKSSIIITTNKSFNEWGEVFKDDTIAAAILDRLLHHSKIFKMTGKSFRLKEKKIDMEKEKVKITGSSGVGQN